MRLALQELAAVLDNSIERTRTLPVVAGFDGFIDQIYHVVAHREGPDRFERMTEMSEFGAWASASSGKSGLREAVLAGEEAGGCAVNQGDSLAMMGFPLDAFVGCGTDSVFDDFRAKCAYLEDPGVPPGRTMVYEFHDGKLMLCSFSHFESMTPDYLRGRLLQSRFRECCSKAAGIVMTSWSVYPHMNDCWQVLQEEVLAGLANRPRLFFDLADPASRNPADLSLMADRLQGFEAIGPVTLSLNMNEAQQLARALDVELSSNAESLACVLRERIGITTLGIHQIKSATNSSATGVTTVSSAYTRTPRKSVGAGDRFNAGWLAGMLLNLSPEAQLLLGCANSGFFVRNARSANLAELAAFARTWAAGELK